MNKSQSAALEALLKALRPKTKRPKMKIQEVTAHNEERRLARVAKRNA